MREGDLPALHDPHAGRRAVPRVRAGAPDPHLQHVEHDVHPGGGAARSSRAPPSATAWAFFNIISYIFYGVIAGLAIGYLIGEAVSLATNRKAGPPLQAIAVGGVLLAYVVRTVLLVSVGDWGLDNVRSDLFGLIVAGLAGFIAAGRLR